MTKQRKETPKQTSPRILLWDIETTPITVHSWTLYPESISHDNIVQDWSIICAAFKFLGNPKVYSYQQAKPYDDFQLVKNMRDVIAQADILVGHNIKKFDTKKFNARLIFHGLEPLPHIPQVDTLREAKKIASFTSNRLDYLDKFFGGKGKLHTEYSLWLDVIKGSRKALQKMVTYCKEDVVVLERLYLKLRPYMTTHPHVAVLNAGTKLGCPKCGSVHITREGYRVTESGNKQQRLKCQSCGGWHQVPLTIIKTI